MAKRALVLGASGLVGRQCLDLLLKSDEYEHVVAIVRTEIDIKSDKLQQKAIDFNQMNSYEDLFCVDDVFCCLGSTIKKAKTREAFRAIDYGFCYAAAEISKRKGVSHFLIVTALGANKQSLFFYSRVKGDLESSLSLLGVKHLSILQPSLLLGERSEFRWSEVIVGKVFGLFESVFRGSFIDRYMPIQSSDIARAMINLANDDRNTLKPISYYTSEKIKKFSQSKQSKS